tara:strand:- start:14983 stop:15930 length:948 start_codon:yes stop_codon:yes gene_type:complete
MNNCELLTGSTILQAIEWANQILAKGEICSSKVETEIILGNVCQLRRIELYLMHDRQLDQQEVSRFSDLVYRRIDGEPLQYLTGVSEFYGRSFSVTPAVMIPRPETEMIVDLVRPFLEKRTGQEWHKEGLSQYSTKLNDYPVKFADIGTGSGVLSVTLTLEFPSVTCYATDISGSAIKVARENAKALSVENYRLYFLQGFLLDPLIDDGIFDLDLIVSNPPYIATKELDRLPKEIRSYEPQAAFDGGENGLEVFSQLINNISKCLKVGGMIVLEIGATQSSAVTHLMIASGVYESINTVKDYNGLDRFITAIYVG